MVFTFYPAQSSWLLAYGAEADSRVSVVTGKFQHGYEVVPHSELSWFRTNCAFMVMHSMHSHVCWLQSVTALRLTHVLVET
jgi:hypothetical protein